MRDNRKLERFGLKLPAKIKSLPDSKENEVMDLLTGNVSAGGAFFYTDKSFAVGTEVKIELILPLDKLRKIQGKKTCIKVTGKVLRADRKGMAVCFDKSYSITPL